LRVVVRPQSGQDEAGATETTKVKTKQQAKLKQGVLKTTASKAKTWIPILDGWRKGRKAWSSKTEIARRCSVWGRLYIKPYPFLQRLSPSIPPPQLDDAVDEKTGATGKQN